MACFCEFSPDQTLLTVYTLQSLTWSSKMTVIWNNHVTPHTPTQSIPVVYTVGLRASGNLPVSYVLTGNLPPINYR